MTIQSKEANIHNYSLRRPAALQYVSTLYFFRSLKSFIKSTSPSQTFNFIGKVKDDGVDEEGVFKVWSDKKEQSLKIGMRMTVIIQNTKNREFIFGLTGAILCYPCRGNIK